MTPQQLGQELRQLVLRQRLEGRGLDTRRLQAAIGDLCGAEHGDLVAPLRYLVLSAAFASAAGQDPPLADPRLLGRLQQELAQMYAERLCQRLRPVLEGLLGMVAVPPAAPTSWGTAVVQPSAAAVLTPPVTPMPPAMEASVPLAAAPVAARMASPGAPASRHGGASSLTVVLAFVSGMLLMALAGIGLVLQQRPQPRTVSSTPQDVEGARGAGGAAPSSPSAVTTPAPPVAATAGEPPSQHAAISGTPAVTEAAALDRALASVTLLYEALSAKDYARARSLFGAAAADQFDPAFFDQFARVSVEDLRPVNQSGATVNLEGVVTFVYPDGSVQTETRTFTLDSSSEPALITASTFGRVIKPR